jgi:hypothetical protein
MFARRHIPFSDRQMTDAILIPDEVAIEDNFFASFKNKTRLLDLPMVKSLLTRKKAGGKKKRKRTRRL